MNKREFIREFTASSIKLFDQDENLIYKGKVNDISAGGILVVSCGLEDLEGFYPGEGIKFTLQIPTGEVSGVAEIAWTDPEESRMGLKFLKILNKDGVSNLMAFVTDGFLKIE